MEWVKVNDRWRPAPKHSIKSCTHDSDSLTVAFGDGFTRRFTRQELGYPYGIQTASVGVSRTVIAVLLDLDQETRALTAGQLRELAAP